MKIIQIFKILRYLSRIRADCSKDNGGMDTLVVMHAAMMLVDQSLLSDDDRGSLATVSAQARE
eukprot:3843989-Amphidinium_carterae.1